MSRTSDSLLIAAFHSATPENFLIDLKSPKDDEILTSFDHDYEFLVENLSILNKRLVLLNPDPKKKKNKKST